MIFKDASSETYGVDVHWGVEQWWVPMAGFIYTCLETRYTNLVYDAAGYLDGHMDSNLKCIGLRQMCDYVMGVGRGEEVNVTDCDVEDLLTLNPKP